jgi:hypothetical protein
MATQFTYNNVTGFKAPVFLRELSGYSLDGIMTDYTLNGADLTVNFSQDLTTQEETDLNTIVSNHPEPKWELTLYLDNYRWGRETGGVMSNGYGIDTSDRSKALINGAYNLIKDANTPAALMDFKTASGWQSLTHSTVESIALDVGHHIEKCFSAEKHVTDLIWAGTVTTEAQVVTEFETKYATL